MHAMLYLFSVESLFAQNEKLLKVIEDTRRQVYQNTQLLTELLQAPRSSEASILTVGLFDMPIKSVDQMDELEKWLSTSANYTALVSLFILYNYMRILYVGYDAIESAKTKRRLLCWGNAIVLSVSDDKWRFCY